MVLIVGFLGYFCGLVGCDIRLLGGWFVVGLFGFWVLLGDDGLWLLLMCCCDCGLVGWLF